MTRRHNTPLEIYRRNRLLTERLQPVVARGMYQHFHITPLLPVHPLRPVDIRKRWAALASAIRAGALPERLNLYVHVPFCSQRCAYCIYHSQPMPADDTADVYLSRLLRELDFYAGALEGVRVGAGYIGGGTPTVLSTLQLERLLSGLRASYQSLPGALWAFECNPLTATADKVRCFVKHGFNRASFGIQSLAPAVLQRVNRGYQSEAMVFRLIDRMRRHRLWINVDLIHGLPGEEAGDLVRSVRRLKRRGVTQIEVYLLSPYTPDGSLRDPDRILPASELAARIREAVGGDGTEVLEESTSVVVLARPELRADNLLSDARAAVGVEYPYDDASVEPVSLLGFGPTARSRICGRLVYQQAAYDPREPWQPQAPGPQGRRVTRREDERRFVTYHFSKHMGVRPSRFAEHFGKGLWRSFGRELRALRELGMVEETTDWIGLRSADPAERFAALLFFASPAALAAAEREVPLPGGGTASGCRAAGDTSKPAPGTRSVELEVSAGSVRCTVVVVPYRPGEDALAVEADWACFIPQQPGQPSVTLTAPQQRCAAAFCAAFRRVIRTCRPRDVETLAAELLRLTAPRPTNKQGRALRIRRLPL